MGIIVLPKRRKCSGYQSLAYPEIWEIVDRIQAGLGEHYNSADLVFGNVGSFSSFRHRFSETIRRSGVVLLATGVIAGTSLTRIIHLPVYLATVVVIKCYSVKDCGIF